MSAQVSQAFVPLLSRPSGYVPAMPPKARPADVVGDDLSDRYIFVDAAKFGSYDVLYDDTTTVSDVVNRVSRMIGRNYFSARALSAGPGWTFCRRLALVDVLATFGRHAAHRRFALAAPWAR